MLILLAIGLICKAQNSDEVALLNNSPAHNVNFFPGNLVYLHFECVDGKVLVPAKINGQIHTFMIDTGAPSIVINSDNIQFSECGNGIGGLVPMGHKHVKQFECAGLVSYDFEALALDVGILEEAVKQKLGGLIGYDFFKELEVVFDYNNNNIILAPANNPQFILPHHPRKIINFQFFEHLPVIALEIDGKKYNFGIDSGSETNIIFDNTEREISKFNISNIQKASITGLNGKKVHNQSMDIQNVKLSDLILQKMNYSTSKLKIYNTELKLHGLLGFPFLRDNLISINYQSKQISIW